MPRQNVLCAEGDIICMICAVGDDLKDDEPCKFDDQRTDDNCPGFECSEQCRLCPKICEFLYKPIVAKCKDNSHTWRNVLTIDKDY